MEVKDELSLVTADEQFFMLWSFSEIILHSQAHRLQTFLVVLGGEAESVQQGNALQRNVRDAK